ncbi:MAG: glycosyltransferase [Candidatus Micrarchaeota archaeon]
MKKCMKIALFTDTFHPQKNGVVVFLDQVLNRLSRDHEVLIVAPGLRPGIEMHGKVKVLWVRSVPFPFYKGYRISAISPRDVEKIIKKEKPDIVHSHAPVVLGVFALLAARRLGIRSVATYHTHFEEYFPHLFVGFYPKFLKQASSFTTKKLVSHFYSKADVVTAPSSEFVHILKSYGIKNTELLENGVELGRLKGKIIDFRKKYSIPKEKKVALYLGRVSFEKKLGLLINAFKKLDAILVIAGSGPYLDKCRKLAHGMKNVVFTGFVEESDLASIYRMGDVFVSASDTETFGLTFLEGMACGLPIVCPKSPGISDLVEDKVNGLLFKPNDLRDLQNCVMRLLGNKKMAAKMAVANRKKAGLFSMKQCCEKTVRLYRRLLDG